MPSRPATWPATSISTAHASPLLHEVLSSQTLNQTACVCDSHPRQLSRAVPTAPARTSSSPETIMEDSRPLPQGWVKQFDDRYKQFFFVRRSVVSSYRARLLTGGAIRRSTPRRTPLARSGRTRECHSLDLMDPGALASPLALTMHTCATSGASH